MTARQGNKLPPRLSRQQDFRRVYRAGRRFRNEFLQIVVSRVHSESPLNGNNSGKVGFIVTRKAAGNAVRRNRIKRLMRESVRKWWGFIRHGHNIILTASYSPEIDHAVYVENILVKLLLTADVLTDIGKEYARKQLSDKLSEDESGR